MKYELVPTLMAGYLFVMHATPAISLVRVSDLIQVWMSGLRPDSDTGTARMMVGRDVEWVFALVKGLCGWQTATMAGRCSGRTVMVALGLVARVPGSLV